MGEYLLTQNLVGKLFPYYFRYYQSSCRSSLDIISQVFYFKSKGTQVRFAHQIKKLKKETSKMYHQFLITLTLLAYFDFENVQSASIGTIAQNIHSDLLLLDANLGSSIRSNREGRRINLNKFAVPSGMINNTLRW